MEHPHHTRSIDGATQRLQLLLALRNLQPTIARSADVNCKAKPIERVEIYAARQEAADACLRLPPVQENGAGHVEGDEGDQGRAPQPGQLQLAQEHQDTGIELARGRAHLFTARREPPVGQGSDNFHCPCCRRLSLFIGWVFAHLAA